MELSWKGISPIFFHLCYVNWTFVTIVASSSKPAIERGFRGKSSGPTMTTRSKSSGEISNFIVQRKEGMVVPKEGQLEEEKSSYKKIKK